MVHSLVYAKGRMLASFVLVCESKEKAGAAYWLLCRRSLGQFVQKLKCLLRSKVVIEAMRTTTMEAYGLLGCRGKRLRMQGARAQGGTGLGLAVVRSCGMRIAAPSSWWTAPQEHGCGSACS